MDLSIVKKSSILDTIAAQVVVIAIVIGCAFIMISLYSGRADVQTCLEQFGTDKVSEVDGKLSCIAHDGHEQMAKR